MGIAVCMGGMGMCTFGAGPGSILVLPSNKVMTNKMPAGNINDYKPIINLPTFNMCMSPANPAVAAATTAALGVLTPMPCIPATSAPWIVGAPTVMLANMPMLNNSSTCICSYGGVITVSVPGQFTTMV